jgi:uncharacterized membrane protein HdeD (DUF308 family)
MAIDRTTGTRERAIAGTWGGPFVLGLLITLGGIFCMVASAAAGVASAILFGALMAVAGILEIVSAFRFRRHSRFMLYVLAGALAVAVGALLILRPMVGLAAITLLLAGYFLASGLLHGVTAVVDRYGGWGWDLLYAAVSVFLGVIIFAGWPLSSLWVVGVVIGAEIAVRGIALMGASLQLRRALRGELPGGAAV